jgi:hypothetical protein
MLHQMERSRLGLLEMERRGQSSDTVPLFGVIRSFLGGHAWTLTSWAWILSQNTIHFQTGGISPLSLLQ